MPDWPLTACRCLLYNLLLSLSEALSEAAASLTFSSYFSHLSLVLAASRDTVVFSKPIWFKGPCPVTGKRVAWVQMSRFEVDRFEADKQVF